MRASVKEHPPLYLILYAISIFHLTNDTLQSIIPALFPIIQTKLSLPYSKLGFLIFCNYLSAAIMQPLIGAYTDKNPVKYLLLLGALLSCAGIWLFLEAKEYTQLLIGAILVGLGSSIFHPEASRIVVWSAGNKKGLSQSIFQIGGNAGQALGPLLIALLFKTSNDSGNTYLISIALLTVIISAFIARWHAKQLQQFSPSKSVRQHQKRNLTKKQKWGLFIILVITLARTWYTAGITGYYALYLMNEVHHLSLSSAQLHVFIYMFSAAIGTFVGGPLADRYGKKKVLVWSILLAIPFTSLLNVVAPPYTYIVLMLSGFFLVSGFAVALIYLLDLIPGRTGWVSGIIFGLSFGLGGLGSMIFGQIGDLYGLTTMMQVCSLIPLIGLLVFFLPSDKKVDL